MARTLNEIKSILTTRFMNSEVLAAMYGFEVGASFTDTFSLVSFENLVFDVVAFSITTIEQLWDAFKTEITALMAEQKPHTRDWYRNKALGFMLGVPVTDGTDQFITDNLTDEQIAAAKIVKQAAAVKLISAAGYGILRLKVATMDGESLAPIQEPNFTALKSYMLNKVVDAGTQITITTGTADLLRLRLDCYYDPLVLNPQGQRLDGTADTPVQDAIDAFLQDLEFNGTISTRKLERALEDIEGVLTANITSAASKYGGYSYDQEGIANVGAINVFRVADSGYFKMDDLLISWKLTDE
ncbi:hypothetical protein NBRC110019_07350 [Neptunitalea chrysea]|uniref:Nucleotidyltransferase n=1 Tax=Neptunitalea chrysea TaxID=1647581 RepID=A0A9W6EUG5_9FLAO|nr:hypothetical protein [Neptunitalea chrysea]GLB51696.1 hypothetical protein NBRC110019_07350 [Neptunitalea chrysea]